MNHRLTLSKSIALFLLECEASGLKPLTLKFYQNRLGKLQSFLGDVPLCDITPTDIREYQISIQHLSKATQHSCSRAIKRFFNFCMEDELIEVNPFAKVRMPKQPKPLPQSFTRSEVKAILDAAKPYPRETAIVYFLLDTGIRAKELCSLQVSDIDGNEVTIRDGKGGKDRYVFLGPQARKRLLRYWLIEDIDDGAAFRNHKGHPMGYASLRNVMDRLKQVTGIKHVTAHNFRKTFCLESLRSGMDVYTLSRLMGHSGISVLRHYLGLLSMDLEKAAYKHNVVERFIKGK